MLADELDFVVGVDSHRDWHTLAVVEVRNGVLAYEARVLADSSLKGSSNWVVGGNKKDTHLTGANPGRDFQEPEYGDFTTVLHNQFYVLQQGKLVDIWPLTARGLLT